MKPSSAVLVPSLRISKAVQNVSNFVSDSQKKYGSQPEPKSQPEDSFLKSFLELDQNTGNKTSLSNITFDIKCEPTNCINKVAEIQGPTKSSRVIGFEKVSINVNESLKLSPNNSYKALPTRKDDMIASIRANSKNNVSLVEDDPNCKSSEVFYNVTLRGGLRSGKFNDRGEMENIKQCVKLCCLLEKCDLAFMLSKTCFTVDCINEDLCDAVPARSAIYLPSICYVYVKSAANST